MADGSLPAGAVQDATTITAPQNQNQRPGYYAALQHPQQPQPPQAQNANQPYYAVNYPPGAWQNAWQMAGYPYASGSAPYQQHHYSQIPYTQYQSQQYMTQFQHYPQPKKSSSTSKAVHKPRTPSPSPPPPELHRHWDGVIKAFLKKVGFHQALRGFEDDMFVLNADWERKKVPGAIGDLMRDLMTLGKSKDDEEDEPKEEPLEERKLEYVHLSTGEEPRSQTSINKSISTFLSQNRARNDASNRAEFLESLSQKRRRLNPDAEASSSSESIPSCARTDAKEINRDLQMKYDIAKNEEGPLRRTMKAASAPATTGRQQTQPITGTLSEEYLSERHPGLDERLKNIETHLAVRYGTVYLCYVFLSCA
ncbi:hypothetical protein SERLA73DRAFT_156976 [Serpula lacrymans var. lacrymans S7.3]|uniref:Uncharacterized protein n=1 Tax=Serpula lacrymans var. lacrymans (strain S7.3) TaxID=936435 RepID=F8QGS6_SERL3|nr:hypothetical protein SERLA73DRAFT_156976 [Serpula lacrymans var. lacrymans S7.3]